MSFEKNAISFLQVDKRFVEIKKIILAIGDEMKDFNSNHWALILGGSSGIGLATAKKLSKHGMNVFVVHRDRRGSMAKIEKEFDSIRENKNIDFCSINVNALEKAGREEVVKLLKEKMKPASGVRLLLHSIALGNLKGIVPSDEPTLEEEDFEQTIFNMGTSLLTWVQEIFKNDLFSSDARVIGLTSEGNSVAWKGYAAVAAAKVTLESISRAIAVEFAPHGIRSNILQPGVTLTPALKLIPGSNQMEDVAMKKNPYKRMTTPEDVANVVSLMCTDEASWINGSLIRVDGGEHIASL